MNIDQSSQANTDHHYGDFKTITVVNNSISYSDMVKDNYTV